MSYVNCVSDTESEPDQTKEVVETLEKKPVKKRAPRKPKAEPVPEPVPEPEEAPKKRAPRKPKADPAPEPEPEPEPEEVPLKKISPSITEPSPKSSRSRSLKEIEYLPYKLSLEMLPL